MLPQRNAQSTYNKVQRRAGRLAQRDCQPNSSKLNKIEEEAIVACILELDAALNKDLRVIELWFKLVANTKEKYRILDKDTHKFNKSSFIIGIITA
ncbi:uncharacterized protein M421DRAFT_427021 [Didymella exigua CBS 183.55]|uniref:Uncharacterized protein n=1 Tax=Didymella exigua CBS 183.55 TaxID=1150837 RepID=A0A6A5R5B7_9PLEO|nr:uncharacterized protein M421DRAFT_427021 [Didymella exigua CBS 183.55]KAF1922348.1 hypothetical protein M421DRAFT_427021 [Didymella exigua CBS 183.55]